MADFVPLVNWVSAQAIEFHGAQIAAAVAPPSDIAAIRDHYDGFNRRQLAEALDHYPVDVTEEAIAGVATHRVTAPEPKNDGRVLICLHGGAFMWGAGAGALLEAVPVAATSGWPVVAVDYALAPEHVFPAAVDDVLGVYRALLETHEPKRIGIYGCSAGAGLTAQTVARLIADGDPPPGAVAMLHGAGLDVGGDAPRASALLHGTPVAADPLNLATMPYLAAADPRDPLVFPGEHPDVLGRFPPSLLVTGSRDFFGSAVTVMHRRLLAAGVEAQLVHFDGMWHAHHMATTLPESRETFALLTRFFSRHLG